MRFLVPVSEREKVSVPSLFDDVFNEFFNNKWFSDMSGNVPMNVSEDEKNVLINLEIPGVDKSDINVEYEDGLLKISGEKKEEKKEGKHYREIRYGKFSRVINVGNVDFEKSTGEYEKGILTLTLPKTEEVKKTQKLEIK